MTEIEPSIKEFEEKYKDYLEKPEYRKQLEEWYQKEKNLRLAIIPVYLFFLGISSFGQFALLDYSFGERLDLSDSDKIFGIEIQALLSLLVTAALPITTLVDESEILGERIRIKISLFIIQLKLSPIIWIILPGDVLLTLQAVLVVNNESSKFDYFIPAIAFVLATIFSISALYLTKGIVAAAKKYMSARKNLQIITVYGVNPIPLYKNAEQIKLSEENEVARKDAEQARQQLEEERRQYQHDLGFQQREYEDKIASQQAEHSKELQELEGDLKKYKAHVDSLRQLKTTFNQIKKPIVDLISQSKGMFEKFSTLDESLKTFSFPKLEISSDLKGKTVEVPSYYWRWQNSNDSWQDLQLPSELSAVGYSLLSVMQQQQELPSPNIRNYAPREGLLKCLVLDFDNYGVIAYCRDEEYRKDGEKWDTQAQLDFKRKLADHQIYGYCTLEFTAQEIMRDTLRVLEQIKDAINSKNGNSFN